MRLTAQDGHVYRARIELGWLAARVASVEAVRSRLLAAGLEPISVTDLHSDMYEATARYHGPDVDVELPDEIVHVDDLGVG